ncbi:hypothetical protein RI578_19905 [Streptomyces sp. BB1-1-1]|uniref:hypothetical protein n=2 Tax=unclassified Streptomyces TaxID=2593676 RepID=UPI002877F640|nr:hypothetical protein [Streptomyces sp. BB1-1-1]WND36409.1 hypothetical protein RI578_19905 [Streptomyces sp. BB1-1-1]
MHAPAGQLDQEGTTMWSRRRDRAEDAVRADAVQAASALTVHLQGGGNLVPVQADGLALAAGEVAFADVACSAARFYGTEVDYPTSASGYFEDHPTFGRRWVSNGRLDARRRQEAEDAALPQWRDHTAARVVLTSTGVRLLPLRAREWMPFDHALLTGVAAEPSAVVLSYSTCAPLLLSGPAAPWLGVAIEHLRHGAA